MREIHSFAIAASSFVKALITFFTVAAGVCGIALDAEVRWFCSIAMSAFATGLGG
jgi:hypothetical protein